MRFGVRERFSSQRSKYAKLMKDFAPIVKMKLRPSAVNYPVRMLTKPWADLLSLQASSQSLPGKNFQILLHELSTDDLPGSAGFG